MRTKTLPIVIAGLGLLAGPFSPGLAQDRPGAGTCDFTGNAAACTPTDLSGVPIDLLPPGARALGLAGAFAGVADDATAAVANPAGLTILSASEFSIHYRDSDFDIGFLDVDAVNSGVFDLAGNLNKTYNDSGSDVSFASFVKPFDRFTISAYYLNQVSLDSRATPETTTDAFFLDSYTNVNELASEVEAFGLGFGWRVSDSFSVGLSIQRTDLEVRSFDFWGVEDFFDAEFFLSDLSCDPAVGGALGVSCGTAETYSAVIDDFNGFGTLVDGDDSDTTFNAGLLFSPSSKWSFGLVYRQGGDFEFTPNSVLVQRFGCTGSSAESAFCQNFFASSSETTSINPIPSNPMDPNSQAVAQVSLPDTLTFGIAWRPTETLLVSLDINDVGYGDLPQIRNVTLGFNVDANDQAARANFFDPALQGLAGPVTEPIDDETTIHLGLEKVFPLSGDFLSMYTLTLRGGAFTDPDHDGNALVDSDDTHTVFGIGATFGDHLQVDIASEFSDRVDNLVLSAIYRF